MPRRKSHSVVPDQDLAEALRCFKAEVFQVLAHPTRIHIAECLLDNELSVGELLHRIPVEPANLSQHLALLRSKRLVVTRKDGNVVHYRLRDPLLADVLNSMRRFFLLQLEETASILREMGEEESAH